MSSAYVMINTVPDKVETVLNDVKEIDGVKEAYIIYGLYDIIAGVEAKKNDDLWDIIIKIRKLKNILSTITLQVTS